MPAFLVVSRWPEDELSSLGRATQCFLNGTEDHMGLLFTWCTPDMVAHHSDMKVSHPTARGTSRLLDYMQAYVPLFQGLDNEFYWTARSQSYAYEILLPEATMEKLHALCCDVARWGPKNKFVYRLNLMLGGILPFHTGVSNIPQVAPSHCAALCLRTLAAAVDNSNEPFQSDEKTFAVLQLDRGGVRHPCQPSVLTATRRAPPSKPSSPSPTRWRPHAFRWPTRCNQRTCQRLSQLLRFEQPSPSACVMTALCVPFHHFHFQIHNQFVLFPK